MTVHQIIKARLIGQAFKPIEAKAIIAICEAVEYARPFRNMWDAETVHVHTPQMEKLIAQVDAIGRAYRKTFITEANPASLCQS